MAQTKTLAVRIAILNDVEQLLELVQYAYRGGKDTKSWTGEEHLVKGPRITHDKLVEKISSPDGAVLMCELVESGGKPRLVGCIHVERSKENPREAHIGMLAVDPDQQSLGVGSRLMRSMEDYARRQFQTQRIVGEVISGRTELMGWYARMGYHPTGQTAPFLGPEHGVTPLVDGLHFQIIEKTVAPLQET